MLARVMGGETAQRQLCALRAAHASVGGQRDADRIGGAVTGARACCATSASAGAPTAVRDNGPGFAT
jgi:hypothetical protein